MTETAWQVLRGLAAWQVGDIPQLPLARDRDGGPAEGDWLAAQLHTVSQWYQADTRDTRECWQVILGSQQPPALETAVGARRGDPDWNQRLADGLEWFEDLHFPLIYLTTAPPGGEAPGAEGTG